MKTSIWSPLGLFKLNGKEPIAKQIYRQIVGSINGQFSTEPGTFFDDAAYSIAISGAFASELVERTFGQMLPSKVYELLPSREKEYGIIPGPSDSITERRAVLAARMLVPMGCDRANVENALKALLGDDFVGWRVTLPGERLNYPTNLGDQPQNLALPSVPRVLVNLTYPISINLGTSQAASFTQVLPELNGARISALTVGDKLVVEPEILGRTETVTIEALGSNAQEEFTLTATFNNPHEPGCIATTMPFPLWIGNQRESLFVLKPSAATNTEKRRKVHELLERMLRATSTWGIAMETEPHMVGPLTLDDTLLGLLDANPLSTGTVPIP
jgi:hypothetical protein